MSHILLRRVPFPQFTSVNLVLVSIDVSHVSWICCRSEKVKNALIISVPDMIPSLNIALLKDWCSLPTLTINISCSSSDNCSIATKLHGKHSILHLHFCCCFCHLQDYYGSPLLSSLEKKADAYSRQFSRCASLLSLYGSNSNMSLICVHLPLVYVRPMFYYVWKTGGKLVMFRSPRIKSLKPSLFLKKTMKLSNKDIIGSGGFGTVYKLIINDCISFAVKRLNRFGADQDRGFERELEAMGDIKHRNIVTLHGYYTALQYNLLIYELMPNGSLDALLHGLWLNLSILSVW